jgi:hypothetical protein
MGIFCVSGWLFSTALMVVLVLREWGWSERVKAAMAALRKLERIYEIRT